MGISEKLNQILAEWNPIDVPKELAFHEYKQYVSIFFSLESDDFMTIFEMLENIALDISSYNSNDENHKKDLESIAQEIYFELNK